MKKSNFMPTVVLCAICLASALLLSVINIFTSEQIAKNKAANADKALVTVYPGGSGFEKLDITNFDLPASITGAYKESSGGFVVESTVKGYKDGLVILCGINPDGVIVGADYIASNETLSAEVGLGDRFVGKTEGEMTPDIVAGSTAKATTGAYYRAIQDCLTAAKILGGGKSLDQTLNEALGTEGLKFEKWFKVASVQGIDTVYTSSEGYVFAIGESFVGVDRNGVVKTADVSGENLALANAAYTVIAANELSDITSYLDGKNFDDIEKAYVTGGGNYVFEIKARGYKYHSNMEFAGIDDGYFYIKLSISADGKIIDCVTLSHKESYGYGDICATEEYYEQWFGKTDSDINVSVKEPDFHANQIQPDNTDIGAIASSTFTTHGYQTAVKLAFKAFDELTGGSDNE